MSLALTVTHQPRLQVQADRGLARRRFQTVTQTALEVFSTLWSELFQDARTALSREAVMATLEDTSNELDTRALLDTTWQTVVDVPARLVLPALGLGILDDAARAAEPTLTELAEQPVTWTPGLPETEQWLLTYAGIQIRDIRTTSLTTVHRVLHDGWTRGQSPALIARRLRAVIGLTPSQEQTIARLRARLTAAGQRQGQVNQAVRQATERALRIRAELIARTEVHTLAQAGAYQALQQAVRAGKLDGDRVRRYWVVAGAPCPRCGAIPGLNPDGVGADAPFLTPEGPVMFPTLHPNCRCSVRVAVVPVGVM